jgi:PAS domain S-box-containing protein
MEISMVGTLKILIVEDVPTDAELVLREIAKSGIRNNNIIVETQDDYIAGIEQFNPDIILSDYSLPLFDGMRALMIRQRIAPSIPFILVTGSINRETAVELMKAGADDFVIKEHISRIGSAIKTALEKKEILKAKKKAEDELKILSRAIEQNPVSILLTNIQGEIKYVNPKFTELTGYRPEEVMGKTPAILKSGFTSTEEYKELWTTISNGNEWRGEFRNKKKNGEIYFESALISPILDEKGKITHFLAVKEDITEKKNMLTDLVNAKDKAVLSEMRFRSLFENMIEGFAYFKVVSENDIPVDFIYVEVNSAFERITGLKNVIGKRVSEIIPGILEMDPELIATFTRVAESGIPERLEIFVNALKEWYSIALYSPENGYFITVFDVITERKLTENELILSKEKAEESDRLKTAFLHNISHEIRTPMNAIIGFSEFLNDPELLPAKRRNFTNIIIQSSNQLLSVITDIINIATIEAGQEKLHLKEVNISTICHLIYEQFIKDANAEQLKFSYSEEPGQHDIKILSDETKLIQVLSNLVENALKFTKQGYVRFGYSIKENEIEFFTEDSGIGVSADMHEEIFKRFRQVEFTATRQYGGSGLGLSISKAYVELLGGKIWLTSTPGKGSTFYFTIPHDTRRTPDNGGSSAKGQPIQFKKPVYLLIAEDDDSNYMLLEEILTDQEIHITRALNGQEAVEYCRTNRVDLVLMDIKMPLLDGCEASRQIKKFKPKLPIIAQTAYTMTEEKDRAIKAGCDNYITKPIKSADLLRLINQYCG